MGELRIRYIEQTGERGEEVTADYARPKNPLIIPSLSLSHAQQRERRYCVDNPLSRSRQRTSDSPSFRYAMQCA